MADASKSSSKLNLQTQEALVRNNALLVKRIAYHLSARLPQSIQIEDLMQAGMVGLLEAVRSYDDSKGASFETYAGIRIRGNMLDEVRRNDWVPRSVYRNARMISSAIRLVENRLGREARDHEVAAELDISLDEYHNMLNDSNGAHLFGFDDIGVTDDVLYDDEPGIASEPDANVQRADTRERLSQIIKNLPKNEGLVLSLHYEHELNLKEIGDILGVSESRVSQIHSQATHRIKARLTEPL